MSAFEKAGVTRPDGVDWQIDSLSIYYGSLFPINIDKNQQLSVYGVANRLARALVAKLGTKIQARCNIL